MKAITLCTEALAWMKTSESRAANIHDEMNAATGNPKSMWKAAWKVLHQDRNSVDMHDPECRRMTTLLSDIFTEKLQRIRLNINAALSSMAAFVTFPVRGFVGERLTSFSEVTDDEVNVTKDAEINIADGNFVIKVMHGCVRSNHCSSCEYIVQRRSIPEGIQDRLNSTVVEEAGPRQKPSHQFSTDFKSEYYFESCQTPGLTRICPHLNESGNLSHLQSAYHAELSIEMALASIGRSLLIHRWQKIDRASEPRHLGRVRHGAT